LYEGPSKKVRCRARGTWKDDFIRGGAAALLGRQNLDESGSTGRKKGSTGRFWTWRGSTGPNRYRVNWPDRQREANWPTLTQNPIEE
jgi:hypothetical protein